ncbi:MAG: hypothetical protein KDC43_29535 [Saprospiraceae bacterium]|nr:hypothetical protein [Saprospiraceae bacterium]
MKASIVTDAAAEILQDTAGVAWSPAQLVAWLNEAQRAVAVLRPDASSVTGNVDLTAGTKQSLPAGGIRLLAVIRNTGADGSTIGGAIRLVERASLDDYTPDWHSADPGVAVEYIYDEKFPTVFWVNPPSAGGVKVEASYAVTPADCADVNAAIALDDIYQPALLEWVLYRSYARFSDERSVGRASTHRSTFFDLLGIKEQADFKTSPKRREQLK